MPADAGEPLRRTTADAKNHQKMAADAFPILGPSPFKQRNLKGGLKGYLKGGLKGGVPRYPWWKGA